jgi:CDGSH-type Zn-finger protein
MPDVTIRCRLDGPYVIEGPIRVTDAEGNVFPLDYSKKPAIALCRCGHSQNRPFCDGSHRSAGFQAGEKAPQPAP